MMSSDWALRVEGLSKRYRIGERNYHRSLREQLLAGLRRLWPWRAAPREPSAGALSGSLAAEEGRQLECRCDLQTGPSARLEPQPAAFARLNHRGDFWALRDVSFEIPRGEMVGFIGRNGAGKSTLLKVLTRITEPTAGRAEIRGRVGSLLEVGTGFHPELTGRENVFLNGAILGMRREEIRSKFDEIVEFAGVAPFIDTPVKRYSSGMAVRLAFAVAAHLDAEILLVDEVLAVGDAEFERKCLRKMNTVARDGRTVLLVSHNLTAVQRLCRRVIWLDQGQIKVDGPCLPVVRSYIEACKQREHLRPLIKPGSPYRSIDCRVNGAPLGRTVALLGDEPLRVTVVCESAEPTRRPRLDLAFYRSDGLKVFACATDRTLDADEGQRSRRWEFDLCFERLDLAPAEYYFDLGVRSDFQGEYDILWNRVCELTATTAVPAIAADAVLLPPVRASARAA